MKKVLNVSLRKLLERFTNARLVDPDFTPTYMGLAGELQPCEVPMRVA